MAGRFGHNPGAVQVASRSGRVNSDAARRLGATTAAASGDPGLLAWGPEFTRLLDHPRILPYLKFTMDETVVGSHPPVAANLGDRARQLTDVPFLTDVRSTMLTGVRLDRLYGIEMTKTIGVGGSFGVHQDHEGTYQFRQGSMRNSLVVVAWNLTDSGGDNGGVSCTPPPSLRLFLTACAVCVRQFFVFPGSHSECRNGRLGPLTVATTLTRPFVRTEANWPLPASAAAALSAEQLRLPAGAQVPRAPAGSCTIFSEGLVHGTWPWTADHDRRCMLPTEPCQILHLRPASEQLRAAKLSERTTLHWVILSTTVKGCSGVESGVT